MADLLNGIVSVIGDLFVTVETTVQATQTVTTSAAPQQVTTQSTTQSTPTTTSTTSPRDVATPSTSTRVEEVNPQPATSSSTETPTPVPTSTTTTPAAILPTTLLTATSQAQPPPPPASSQTLRVSTSSAVEQSPTTFSSPGTTSSITSPLRSVQLTSSSSSSSSLSSIAPAASSLSDTAGPSEGDHKPAVIGGLVGAIVGLVLVALIVVFCCLRRRRRRPESEASDISEKFDFTPPRPVPYRMPTGASELNFGHAAPLVRPTAPSMNSFKSENGNLIRISLSHFTRPFHEQEGYRDSAAPGLLRVTNPDRSQPATPNLAANRLSDPFNKVKLPYQSTITEREVFDNDTSGLRKLPLVHIEEAPSEYTYHGAPSFRSYPSIHTSSPRTSQWMGEPVPPAPAFTDRSKPKRPTLIPLHSVASRTLSSIGSALRLSSGKTAGDKALQPDHLGYDAGSSNPSRRVSAMSDPFDLDSPTRRSAMPNWQRLSMEPPKNLTTYEGT